MTKQACLLLWHSTHLASIILRLQIVPAKLKMLYAKLVYMYLFWFKTRGQIPCASKLVGSSGLNYIKTLVICTNNFYYSALTNKRKCRPYNECYFTLLSFPYPKCLLSFSNLKYHKELKILKLLMLFSSCHPHTEK